MYDEQRTDTADIVIRGGVVIQEEVASLQDIAIKAGKIHAVAAPGTPFFGAQEVSAHGRIVAPGGIDTHTHIAWPLPSTGGTSHDTFESATRAAAISGTTTVIDFVPPRTGMSLLQATNTRLNEAAGQCSVDYTFHPIITDASSRTIHEIATVIDMGMTSFKVFTTYDSMRLNDGEILDVMTAIGANGGLPGFHAENHEIIKHSVAKLTQAGRGLITDFAASRPQIAEAAAIDALTAFAGSLNIPLFIYHVSGAHGLAAIARARDRGQDIRAETCTHYLSFDLSVYSQENAWMYVICPPIREANDSEALWRGLKSGTLQCVGSDHCSYGTIHKHPGSNNFLAMEAGAPGIDARMPFVWSRGVSEGRLSLVEFGQVTATGPARTFGLYPQKGAIIPGADADLVVIDPDRTWTWPVFETGWGSDFEPYGGLSGRGLPELTLLRGKVVARGGQSVGQPEGRFVKQAKVQMAQ